MNRITSLTATVMILSLFTSKAKRTPEDDFWSWFQINEETLFHFENDQEKTFDRLATEMKKVNPSLTFEFGPVEDGKREFVISADGVKDAFPSVESLYAAAPKLNHWIWIKFRPRRSPMNVEYAGVEVKAGDVFCTIEPDKGKAGLTLYVRGYQPDQAQAYTGIVFLMLDQALGEYDVETRVGFIQTRDYSDASSLQKYPLKEFPKAFDDFFANRK